MYHCTFIDANECGEAHASETRFSTYNLDRAWQPSRAWRHQLQETWQQRHQLRVMMLQRWLLLMKVLLPETWQQRYQLQVVVMLQETWQQRHQPQVMMLQRWLLLMKVLLPETWQQPSAAGGDASCECSEKAQGGARK